MKFLTTSRWLLLATLFTCISSTAQTAPLDDDDTDDIEKLKKSALKQPMSRQFAAMLPFGGGSSTTKKLKNVSQPGDMSQRQAEALIKLNALVDTAVEEGDADQIGLHKDLVHGHRDSFIDYMRNTPGFSNVEASELRSLFLLLFNYKENNKHLFRRILCNMITHIMMVQSKAASKNRLLELTHLLSSYRTQLMTKAAAVHAASSLSEVINSFLTQTQTLTALAPRKGVIRRATGTILWGLGKTLKFILDSPFHILSIPLRLFGLVLRLFGVSKKWAGTPNRWWYKLRTPYYILLVTIALGAATALAAKVAHDREKLTPWTTDPLLTYVINPFIKGNLDAGGIDQGDSSFDIGNLDKGSLESFAVGAAQGFTGAVAAPFVTVGGWGNYLLSKTLGPNGRHIPFTKRTVGPVAPDALRDAVDRLGAAHDTHIATVARKRHFKAFNESLKADLTPDQRALSFTEKLALYPRYQPPAGGTQ